MTQTWDDIYTNNKIITENSTFAAFCLNFMKADDTEYIFDIGCGNARDTIFFKDNGFNIIGIDGSQQIININQQKIKNIQFYNINIDNLDSLKLSISPKYIYSRFVIHSINNITFIKYLNWVKMNLKLGGKWMIECRSTKDPINGIGIKISDHEYIYGHYRRFINIEELMRSIYESGLSIEYITETNNLSIHNDDNPVLIRIIAVNYDFIIPMPNLDLLYQRDKIVNFIENCNNNNINIFALFGTLLGTIRCNGLIPWDTDIDIGILYDDLPKLIEFIKNNNWSISSEIQSHKYIIESVDVIKLFDFNKELIWLYNPEIKIGFQLNILYKDSVFKPIFWSKSDYSTDNFYVHMNAELRHGYESGRYNIPESLFYSFVKHPFYNTYINCCNKSEYLCKKWYGEKCLTHFPNNFESYLDENRFISSNKLIDYIYPI
jgi:tellurite methyltransferase